MYMEKSKSLMKPQLSSLWPTNWYELDEVFDNFRHDLERSLGSFSSMTHSNHMNTCCDIEDCGKDFVITAELPGIAKKDINLDISEDMVEISAKRDEEKEQKKRNFFQKERNSVSFERRLSLPSPVKAKNAKAEFVDGILTITVPKTNPTEVKKCSVRID